MSKKHTLWKTLSCDLTQEEVATYSQELAIVTTEQSEIEARKKEVMSDFTARLNKCIADSRVLANKITHRKEDRNVECDLDFDYAKGMVYTVRTDTGVTIGQRKLTDDERQEWLDFEGEQDRRDAAEEKREEEAAATPPVIEGELLQIEHNPSVEICGNTECHYNDPTEGNGCKQYEMVWECKQAVQEGPTEAPTEATVQELTDEEADRRVSICKPWNECEHSDICFTEQNEIDAICFKDEPHLLPKLGYEGFVSIEEKQEKDGIVPGRVETMHVAIDDKKTHVQIYVAKGDSGTWYAAYSIQYKQGGHSYFPYPNFSDKYPSRVEAVKAACEKVYIKACEMIKDTKPCRVVADALTNFLMTPEAQAD